jgi:hypothetical protein
MFGFKKFNELKCRGCGDDFVNHVILQIEKGAVVRPFGSMDVPKRLDQKNPSLLSL